LTSTAQANDYMPQKDWKQQLTQILERLSALEEKYEGLGQDLISYLDGLYYSNGLTYWEYIHLDSLLGLQMPRTPFKDEQIFIIYHQQTELMFKLIKLELDSLTDNQGKASEFMELAHWHKRLRRLVNYFRHLADSFDIMVGGMESDELRKFRMALLPASGFQSVQFRHIEVMSTGLPYLLKDASPEEKAAGIQDMYPYIYWKQGGIDLETGQKTITLQMFEQRYDEELIQLLHKYRTRNLYHLYIHAPDDIRQDETLRELMREYDRHVNIYWKLSHLAAASRHLSSSEGESEGTGGTNWRSFLPPRFQRIIFFPLLWSAKEKENWGRDAVLKYFQQEIRSGWMQDNGTPAKPSNTDAQ
jgi:tryptophan 2,3-dioxygenase